MADEQLNVLGGDFLFFNFVWFYLNIFFYKNMYNQNVKVKKEKMKRTIKIINQRKKASKQLNLQKQSKQANKKKHAN